jgi:hypothetical protein
MAPAVTDRPEMAAYGVPDDLEGVLPWTWARERLRGSRCYWVATADASGRPHLMPVWGVWLDEPDAFWFGCAPSARKARNLADNTSVSVATEDPQALVSIEGTATPTAEGAVLDAAVAAYWDKYGREMPMSESDVHAFLRSNAGYAVTPERAFGLIETAEEFGPRATRWRW